MNKLQTNQPKTQVEATMEALMLHAPEELSVERVPLPTPGEGEVLLKVEVATTCGTDLKAYLRGHPQIPMPGLFGHEYSGTVVSAGPNAPFSVGSQVMGVHSAPCRNCTACDNGDQNLCDHIMKTKVLGAYAEYLLIPKHIAAIHLFHKPADLDWSRAALLEPLACVAHGLSQLTTRLTDRILVIGPGAIGLMFTAALRAVGIHDVTLLGRNPQRLAVGEAFGARPMYESEIQNDLGRGYDCVIECTGKTDVWERSIDYVRRGGQLMLFGGCPSGSRVSFDTGRVHYDQIKILSPFHFGTDAVLQAREWVMDLSIPLNALISGQRHLTEAQEVFELLRKGVGLKYAFRP